MLPNPSLADIGRIVRDAILRQWPDLSCELGGPAADPSLFDGLGMSGTEVLQLAELLDEDLGVQIWPAELIDLARGEATVGDLARLCAAKLDRPGRPAR